MGRQLFAYHPVIGYRFVPNLKARVQHESGGYLVRTNSLGFRCDHEFAANRQAGVRRILLFGDSYTAGDGVRNGERFGNLLERAIENLEVYNFALPGTGTDQQYLAYREYAAKIKHDLLVIAVLVENIRRVASRYRPFRADDGHIVYYAKPYFELVDGRLLLRNVPVPRRPFEASALAQSDLAAVDRSGRLPVFRRAVNVVGLKGLAQRVTRYQPVPEYARPDSPAWRLLAAILSEWIRSHPTPVLLVPIPLYQHVEGSSDAADYQARFRELAAELGCDLHDPLPDMQAQPPAVRRRFRFRHDVHPTPEGHAALAASLVGAVTRLLGLDSSHDARTVV